jgi:hypothetical protein
LNDPFKSSGAIAQLGERLHRTQEVNPLEPKTLCRYGDVNNLTVSVTTSKLAQANCGQTAVVEIEKFTGELPPVEVFKEPKKMN